MRLLRVCKNLQIPSPLTLVDRAQSFLDTPSFVAAFFVGIFDCMTDRIAVFEQMLAADPENTMVMFGLAKEYEKQGRHADVIRVLEDYLAKAEDEGNAYGVLANAYLQNDDLEKAVETYKKGIEVSMAHGHPSMANEYRMTLEMDLPEPPA